MANVKCQIGWFSFGILGMLNFDVHITENVELVIKNACASATKYEPKRLKLAESLNTMVLLHWSFRKEVFSSMVQVRRKSKQCKALFWTTRIKGPARWSWRHHRTYDTHAHIIIMSHVHPHIMMLGIFIALAALQVYWQSNGTLPVNTKNQHKR